MQQHQEMPQRRGDYLLSIFNELKTGLTTGSKRYIAVDHEHVIDEEKGIKYHLYSQTTNKPYAITSDQGKLLTGDIMLSTAEVKVLDQVRDLLQRHFSDVNRVSFFEMHKKEPEQVEHLQMAEGVELNTGKKKK